VQAVCHTVSTSSDKVSALAQVIAATISSSQVGIIRLRISVFSLLTISSLHAWSGI
jgi:hypothetical protein